MDTLAHGLWAAVAAKTVNKILRRQGSTKKLGVWHAGFWGIFPDSLSFTPLFFWTLARMLTGAFRFEDFGSIDPTPFQATILTPLTSALYGFTHSIIAFVSVFLLVWLISRRPVPGSSLKLRRAPWELCGWLLHLLVDIPTHPAASSPAPLLWPFTELHVGGISWATPTFLIVNYAVLGILFFLLRERGPRPVKPVSPKKRALRILRNVAFAGFVVVVAFGIYSALRVRNNRIVTTYDKNADTQTVNVYFGSRVEDPEAMWCDRTYPTPRRVPQTAAPARAALKELLRGPDRAEAERGFFTSINPGVEINSLTIADSVARVDFDAVMETGMGGSCRVAAVRSQITNTLRRFPSVEEVVIGVEGRVEDALQP